MGQRPGTGQHPGARSPPSPSPDRNRCRPQRVPVRPAPPLAHLRKQPPAAPAAGSRSYPPPSGGALPAPSRGDLGVVVRSCRTQPVFTVWTSRSELQVPAAPAPRPTCAPSAQVSALPQPCPDRHHPPARKGCWEGESSAPKLVLGLTGPGTTSPSVPSAAAAILGVARQRGRAERACPSLSRQAAISRSKD